MRFLVFLAVVVVVSANLNTTEVPNETEAPHIALARSSKCHNYDPEQCHKCAKKDMEDCMECMMDEDKCCLDPHKGHNWMKQHARQYCKKWLKK